MLDAGCQSVSNAGAGHAVPSPGCSTALDLHGKRVTLLGLGTRGGGLGVARYLVRQGAEVTVTDKRPAEELAEPLAELSGLSIRYVLGNHDERDFTPGGADLIVRNPGVPRRAPLLELARAGGIPVEMEMSLFFRACPAPIIGVTGTKGKTTVSTLTGDLLRDTFPDVVVAGNMGISALDQLPRLRPDVPVVIELSSWQLESLIEHRLAPHIAVLTMIAEDHLNTYDGFADYAATKRGRHALSASGRLAGGEPGRPRGVAGGRCHGGDGFPVRPGRSWG